MAARSSASALFDVAAADSRRAASALAAWRSRRRRPLSARASRACSFLRTARSAARMASCSASATAIRSRSFASRRSSFSFRTRRFSMASRAPLSLSFMLTATLNDDSSSRFLRSLSFFSASSARRDASARLRLIRCLCVSRPCCFFAWRARPTPAATRRPWWRIVRRAWPPRDGDGDRLGDPNCVTRRDATATATDRFALNAWIESWRLTGREMRPTSSFL